MEVSKIKSYCKINLSLKVIEKLNNGYHNIASLITFCDLHDLISLTKNNKSKDKITFSGRFKKGINNNSNIVTKLLYLLRKNNLLNNKNFKINIKKNIPHGSGLGGGSSNAAALLNFFNKKENLKLSKKKLIKLGRNLGFDVPISLEKKNTLLSGKKNKILRFNKKFRFNLLIVYPNIICSTKKIYSINKKKSPLRTKYKFNKNNKKSLINYLKKENNDLEETVVETYPKIKNIIDFIKSRKGCYFSRITGSGSACIGIFSNMKAAIYSKKTIKLKFPKCWSVVSKTI